LQRTAQLYHLIAAACRICNYLTNTSKTLTLRVKALRKVNNLIVLPTKIGPPKRLCIPIESIKRKIFAPKKDLPVPGGPWNNKFNWHKIIYRHKIKTGCFQSHDYPECKQRKWRSAYMCDTVHVYMVNKVFFKDVNLNCRLKFRG
jgi:hypothetical protein